MTRHEQRAPDELKEGIARLAAELSADSILLSRPEEPWRQFSLLIQKKIADTLDNKGYTAPSQLRADLWLLARSVDDIGATRITRSEVLPVIRLVDVFGFHGAVFMAQFSWRSFHRACYMLN